MANNNIHIFYHDDVDGIISAAMIMNAFCHNRKYCIYPVKSSMRGSKFNNLIEETRRIDNDGQIAILDYQYHKYADFWADHHFDSDLKYNMISNGGMLYDSEAKSATRVIYDYWSYAAPLLKKTVDQHIIDVVDVIDGVGYKTINEIFSSLEPLMVLKSHLEQLSIFVDSTYNRIVELINMYSFDIKKVLFTLGIDDHRVINNLRESAGAIQRNMVIYGVMGITEMNRLYAYPRYAEYLVNPNLMYSIRIVHLGGGRVQADVGYNKWQKKSCKAHIGQVLGNLDYPISGGGHPTVGGAIILESEVERFIDDMCVQLNGPEDSMEKYSVDKNDSVEKKADELVKTGTVKTKSEAREKVALKMKGETPKRV